jgi:hypothetical protein
MVRDVSRTAAGRVTRGTMAAAPLRETVTRAYVQKRIGEKRGVSQGAERRG